MLFAYDPMQDLKTQPERITMMFKKTLLAAAVFALGGIAFTTQAATVSPATANFQVKMTILASCAVTAGSASDIQIGAAAGVDSNSGSNNGTSNINVQCSDGTPYYVGLAPSNSDTTGAGIMSGTSGDDVPYQLRSVSVTGPVWGNTATSTDVGNGVNGTGDGTAQSIPVFAVAPSANFKPGDYTDVVTVNVNF